MFQPGGRLLRRTTSTSTAASSLKQVCTQNAPCLHGYLDPECTSACLYGYTPLGTSLGVVGFVLFNSQRSPRYIHVVHFGLLHGWLISKDKHNLFENTIFLDVVYSGFHGVGHVVVRMF